MRIAAIIALVIVSITSHEAAHGFVADLLGDPTARERGRLTLNPLRHIDLFFTVLLPLFLILSRAGFIVGGAKPVPVNVSRLRRPPPRLGPGRRRGPRHERRDRASSCPRFCRSGWAWAGGR